MGKLIGLERVPHSGAIIAVIDKGSEFRREPFIGFSVKQVIGELRYRGIVCPHNACKISA